MCYSPWGCKELDVTEQLNLTDPKELKSLPQRGIFTFMFIVATFTIAKTWKQPVFISSKIICIHRNII